MKPGEDVDHMLDLQLGGEDTISNMWPLNDRVNRSLGRQIQAQTRSLTLCVGAEITGILVEGRK